MEPQRRSVELWWGAVSYLEWTPPGEPAGTLVLLHGGGVDSAELSWGPLGGEVAAAGWRVIAPDHPGYGDTPPAPWRATQGRLVEHVGELVDALRLEDYVVGGLSLGGGLALGHTLARGGGVRGLLLFGTYGIMDRQLDGPLGLPAHVLTWVLLRTGALGAIMRWYGRDPRRLGRSLAGIVRDPAQRTAELVDAVVAAAAGPGLGAFEQWQRAEFGWARLRTNYSAELGAITCPVLLVHGERDTGVPVAAVRAAADRIADARLVVVPDAGHWVQRDRPAAVTRAVLDFLGGLG